MNTMQYKKAIEKQFRNKYNNPIQCGNGTYSKVFKCQNEKGEFVAIKVINKVQIQSHYIPYLKNEIQLLQKSDNQNVIKLFESQESDSEIFLVLEYCEMDLSKMMNHPYYNKKIPEDLVFFILKQIMNGLNYLHQNNIIHRDLKLENIGVVINKGDLINFNSNKLNNYDSIFQNASYKILDLGFAKQLVEPTKSYIGSFFYMAPEVIEGKNYSFQADIYSLGVCLFYMITGELPYKQNFTNEYKAQKEQIKFIKQQNAKFEAIENQLFRNIIQQMLEFDVAKRLTVSQLNQSLFEQSLIINSEFYILDQSIIQNQQQENQSEITFILYNEEKSQNLNKEINQQNQLFEKLKKTQIKIPKSDQSIIQTQEFSLIEYPEHLKQSQIKISKSKLESNIEIIEIKEITRWKKQRNVCILILNLCKKLQSFIQSIPLDSQYLSFDGEFNCYIQQYSKLAENLFNQLQKEVNSKNHYQTIQEYRIFKDSLKNIQFINYKDMQTNNWSDHFYQMRNFFDQVNPIIKIVDQKTLQDSQYIMLQNNNIIFNQIKDILWNTNSNEDSSKKEYNIVQCNIYLILADLVVLSSEYQKINIASSDHQIIELTPKDFDYNPYNLCSYLDQIMNQNDVQFEENIKAT